MTPLRVPGGSGIPWRAFRRAAILAGASMAAALTILLLIRPVFGAPVPLVVVTWRGVDPSARSLLERRFQLAEPSPLGGSRWQYVPRDTSPSVLRAVVEHPAAARVEGIDRQTFRASARAPLGPRRGGLIAAPALVSRAAKALAWLLFLPAFVVLAAGAAAVAGVDVGTAARTVRAQPREAIIAVTRAAGGALRRGVPVASAQSAAAFRICFAVLVLGLVASRPAREVAVTAADVAGARGFQHAVAARVLERPALAVQIDWAVRVAGAMVAAGVFTPLATAAFALGFLLWATVFTVNASHHMVASMAVTLLCLVAAPLGDAWSVDAMLRRRSGTVLPPGPARRYGFASWIPGFVFGVAFLAAAWSKVGNGPGWILNGTVRYHFVTDLPHALVPWGPVLTGIPAVAIVMSAAAVLVETGLILASFTRSLKVRAACGACAAALLVGFALFQGVIWPAWWMLLTSFLPWPLIGRQPLTAVAERSLPPAQRAAVVTVLAVQLVASARGIEARPLISAYDMYATTYGSTDDYEAAHGVVYHLVEERSGQVRELPGCDIAEERVWQLPAGSWSAVAEMIGELPVACRAAADADAVTLVGDRIAIDWRTGQRSWRRGVDRVGPFVRRP